MPQDMCAGRIFRNITESEAFRASIPKEITDAAFFIEKAGLKGKRSGDAMVSPTHANFIINVGNATSQDVVSLVQMLKQEVEEKFHVSLSLEVQTIGRT